MIPLTEHKKLKNREDQREDASILHRRGNKITMGEKDLGGRKEREGIKGAGSVMGRDRREV